MVRARARLAARHGGTREIRERERALSPEVLRRVSPRGILGYVRVVQELADNELARSAWCRRFRGVSSFLFFFVTSCRHARALGREQVSERTSKQKSDVYTLCVCVLLLAWCARPLCSLSSFPVAGLVPTVIVVAVAIPSPPSPLSPPPPSPSPSFRVEIIRQEI